MHRKARPRHSKSGFALLIVVLIVALVGVAAVALLDIVNVDLLIVGQHRRTVDAYANAVGAMFEVTADGRIDDTVRPTPKSASPSLVLTQKNGGVYTRDPTGVFGTQVMTSANSAYVDNVGTSLEEGYEATINYLGYRPLPDTGQDKILGLMYETVVVASVNNGDATKEVRAITTKPITVSNGYIPPRIHAR